MAAPTIPYTIPGTVSQARPVMECRLAFESARTADPLAWVDFTEQLLSFEISRGSENELAQIDAGTATVVINDPDRELDPFNTGSPYDVKPRRRLWLRSMWNGEAVDQFYGWTGSFRPEWPSDFEQVAVVPARDGLSLLAGDNMPTTSPPRDTYTDLVLFDNPDAYWKLNEVSHGAVADSGPNGLELVHSATFSAFTLGVEGAIVGDTDTGVAFNSGPIYSAIIAAQNAGDFAGLSEFAVELWWNPAASTPLVGSERWLLRGPISDTETMPQYGIEWNAAGTLDLKTATTTGDKTVTTSWVPTPDTWHHLVGRLSGGTLELFVDSVSVASGAATGTINGPIQTSGNGTVRVGDITSGTLCVFDEAAIYRHALSDARISAHYEAGTSMGHNQARTDEHIDVALQESGISFVPRRLRAGQRDIQPVFFHGQPRRSLWDDAVTVEGDESSAFFAKDGAAVFLDNDHRSVSPWTTVQAVFDDDGTDIAYLGVEMDDGESFLFNDVRRTAKDGTLQWVFNEASIGEYDRIVMDDGETLNVDDADALAEVTAKLAKYKDPQPRVISLALSGVDPEQLEQLLRRELGDKVQVRRRPNGVGVVIDQTSFVRRISLSGERGGNDFWSGSLAVSPL